MRLAVFVVAALDGRVAVADGGADGGEDVVKRVPEVQLNCVFISRAKTIFIARTNANKVKEKAHYVENNKKVGQVKISTHF